MAAGNLALRDSVDAFAGGAHSVDVHGTGRPLAAKPYDFSSVSASVRRGVARRSEHNAERTDWLGLGGAAIAGLTARGVLIAS